MEQNAVYPLFSGHNTGGGYRILFEKFQLLRSPLDQVCVAVALVELGMVQLVDNHATFKMEAPGVIIEIEAKVKVQTIKFSKVFLKFQNGETFITMKSMPSFVVLQGQQMNRSEIISLLPKEVKEKC